MPNLPDTPTLTAATGLLYVATLTAAVITALLTRSPSRRRTAIEILKILVRRNNRKR